jgi:hypothetical protein
LKKKTTEALPESIVVEYNALREEILFRLKVQQDVMNYSLLFVGFIATTLAIQGLDTGAVLIVLLLGPLVGIFLAFVYLKQHIFIEALAGYISSQLSYDTSSEKGASTQKICPFAGWEDHLTKSFYTDRLPTLFTGILELAEGLFPLLMGIACWLLFIALRGRWPASQLPGLMATNLGLDVVRLSDIWAILEVVLLVCALIVEWAVRKWALKQRRSWIDLETAAAKLNPADFERSEPETTQSGSKRAAPRSGAAASASSDERYEERILAYVEQHGSINNAECRELLGIESYKKVGALLHKLRDAGKLRQIGTKRWTRYEPP